MLKEAFEVRKIRVKYVLFDSWYASVANLKYIHRQGRIFSTTLKSNRLVSITKEEGYIHLQDIDWTPERLKTGISVKLKEVPFLVKRKSSSPRTVTLIGLSRTILRPISPRPSFAAGTMCDGMWSAFIGS